MTPEEICITSFINKLDDNLKHISPPLFASDKKKLPYAFEILDYKKDDVSSQNSLKYETDILIGEEIGERWKPRLIVEGKLAKISTHEAITYSNKAKTHKYVHPYLMYGILLGDGAKYPLP